MKIKHLLSKLLSTLDFRQKPFVYVAMGDSTVEGVGASSPDRGYAGILHAIVRKHKKNVLYENFGKLRAPVKEVIEEQLDKTIALQPNLVTISVGANDLRVRTLPKTFEKRLRGLIDRIENETDAQIVINTIPDFSHAPSIPGYIRHVSRFAIKHFNSIIIKVAKEKKIIVVDLFDHGSYYSQHFPEAIAEDGFHPSDIGYAIWANALFPYIKLVL